MTDPSEFPRLSRRQAAVVCAALNPSRMAGKSKARCVCVHPAQLITLFQLTSIQTARSSSASSRPHKQASSIPRSVFGWVPSWLPSSMIREVCVFSMDVPCILGPGFPRRVALRLSSTPLPARGPPAHSVMLPFFFSFGQGKGRRVCAHGGEGSIPRLFANPNACVSV